MSPVLPGNGGFEITYAANQKPYNPLTVMRTEKCVMSRWEFTDEERAHIAAGGNLFICQLNFGQDLQPIMPICAPSETALEILVEVEG